MSISSMSLRTKLFGGFSLGALVTAIIGTIGFMTISGLKTDIEDIGLNNLPSVMSLNIINEAQTAVDGAENALLYQGNSDEDVAALFKKFDAIEKRVADALKIYDPLPRDANEEAMYRDFKETWAKWWADHLTYVGLVKAYRADRTDENYKKQADFALKTIAVTFGAAEQALGKIIKLNTENANKTAGGAIENATYGRLMMIVSIILALMIATILAIVVTSAISKPLKIAVEGMTNATDQVSAASLQLSSAAQQLSSGANEQASSIEETSASLEEMGGMVQNNVTNAKSAEDLANKVKTISESGNSSMEKLRFSMEEILESNKKIEQLVKVIAEIGEKTQVMDDIVFQTKLLSFNASVEAERAGEHGRGFAVVAQEVGILAQMSGKSAQEIAQIVTNSIRQAEAITTENKKKVEQGNGYVVETAKYLKEILGSAQTVADGAHQVLVASQEQSSGIKQINEAMSNLDKATQQNASMAEETASTSEELTAQTETLTGLVDSLVTMMEGGNAKPSHHGRGQVVALANRKGQPAKKPVGTKKAPPPTRPTHLKRAAGSDVGGNGDSDWENL